MLACWPCRHSGHWWQHRVGWNSRTSTIARYSDCRLNSTSAYVVFSSLRNLFVHRRSTNRRSTKLLSVRLNHSRRGRVLFLSSVLLLVILGYRGEEIGSRENQEARWQYSWEGAQPRQEVCVLAHSF
jgi:hypothetical protein